MSEAVVLVPAVLGLLGVVLVVALWSGFLYRPGTVMREVARTSFWFGLLAAVVGLPLVLSFDQRVLAGGMVMELCWPVLVGAVMAVFFLTIPRRWRYFAASCVLTVGVVATALFALLSGLIIGP